MQVVLAVVAFVAADQSGSGELSEVVLDRERAVLGAQCPQGTGDDGGLVAEAAVVVGLGEKPEEGPFRGDRDLGQRLGGEGFRLDGAYSRHVYRPAFAADGAAGTGQAVTCGDGVFRWASAILGISSSARGPYGTAIPDSAGRSLGMAVERFALEPPASPGASFM